MNASMYYYFLSISYERDYVFCNTCIPESCVDIILHSYTKHILYYYIAITTLHVITFVKRYSHIVKRHLFTPVCFFSSKTFHFCARSELFHF